jgi:hypothetical protein
MFERSRKYDLPRTVDEVADLLIADLPAREMITLSHLNREEFVALYESVASYILDEFKIWTGNQPLLDSCLERIFDGDGSGGFSDPALVILRRVWEKLQDAEDIVIVL